MLLKSLKLKDFRQFKGGKTSIQFSVDPYKNVTMIMGGNGSGKTTLAQSFTWCLYGETDFLDKMILCKATALEMAINDKVTVSVGIELIHNGIEYTVIREQIYTKGSDGNIKKPDNSIFKIAYKGNDGQQEFIKDIETEMRMKEILPKELSRYFFFNGERIEAMSKEIYKGRSKEFAGAVRGLLGLGAFEEALTHLNGRGNSVIKNYDNSYDSKSNDKIALYTGKIKEYDNSIDKIEDRLIEIEKEEAFIRDHCTDLIGKIRENEKSEKLAKKKENLENRLKTLESVKVSTAESLVKTFNSKATSYFSIKMINEALTRLAKADKLDKGIPDIHARTIDYLIKRGSCLCGGKIEVGNDAYKELNRILDFIPPQSIGTGIAQFARECELKMESGEVLYSEIKDKYSIIRDYETEYGVIKEDIENIEKTIGSMPNVGDLQRALSRYEKEQRELREERDVLNQKKGISEKERERANTSRQELTLKDEHNRRIEIYKAYSQCMYDSLNKLYSEKETEIRNELEETVNEIFKKIYKGGLSVTVDKKYDIQIVVNDFEGYDSSVETSTAQSISVIFAFIAGVIKMARSSQNPEKEMLVSEAYPLVMDAPLSAFDRTRIKAVCDALPKVAEQVIIFIKDTDGELAAKYLDDRTGCGYAFDKKNEFETYIIAR